MTQKEMKKLSRKRMLEMLAEQTGRANRLLRENERLKERIAEREQHLARLGELAETILNSDSSPDGEPAPDGESIAEASPGSPGLQGDVPCGGQTDPDTVTAKKDEIPAVTKAAASSDDTSGKPGGSVKMAVANVIEIVKSSRKTTAPPAHEGSVTGDEPVRSGSSIVKKLEKKMAAAKKAGAGSASTGSIGSNIRSTASSLAMLGTAAVLLITKKNGKGS